MRFEPHSLTNQPQKRRLLNLMIIYAPVRGAAARLKNIDCATTILGAMVSRDRAFLRFRYGFMFSISLFLFYSSWERNPKRGRLFFYFYFFFAPGAIMYTSLFFQSLIVQADEDEFNELPLGDSSSFLTR